jgi:hypothetical protein
MGWEKIAKWLLIAELIFTFFVVLYILRVALAQTIGIGVSPAVLKYNFPAVYSYEFCFFNQGDTDATYVIQSGDIKVLNEMNFTVPANTNYDNCVKKTLQLVVDKSGYFYVLAYPNINQSSTISIVRRVGVKVELNYLPTTTTISQSSSGSSTISQTTTTTMLKNQSLTTTTIGNLTVTSLTQNETKNETRANISNVTKSEKPTFDLTKVIIGVVVIVGLIGFAYFLVTELDLI